MYAIDRHQTDSRQTTTLLNAPAYWGGGIINGIRRTSLAVGHNCLWAAARSPCTHGLVTVLAQGRTDVRRYHLLSCLSELLLFEDWTGIWPVSFIISLWNFPSSECMVKSIKFVACLVVNTTLLSLCEITQALCWWLCNSCVCFYFQFNEVVLFICMLNWMLCIKAGVEKWKDLERQEKKRKHTVNYIGEKEKT